MAQQGQLPPDHLLSKIQGGLLGCAVGDALGTTVECRTREYVSQHPVSDMVGGGKFQLRAGQWTDDTTMALILLESLLEKSCFVPSDVICKWHSWYTDGHFSPNGECFDIGGTCLKSILRCLKMIELNPPPLESIVHPPVFVEQGCGNGGLMRVVPICLAFSARSLEECASVSLWSSKLTHNAADSLDGCRYMASLIWTCIWNPNVTKGELLSRDLNREYWLEHPMTSVHVQKIVFSETESFREKSSEDVRGYGSAHWSLEAVLWAFWNSDSFEDGVLKVINLGNDADTTAAIFGEIAGTFYGIAGIRSDWVQKVALLPLIECMARELECFWKILRSSEDPKVGVSVPCEYEISDQYRFLKEDFAFLENRFHRIYVRLQPSKLYTSVREFDRDVEDLRQDYNRDFNDRSRSCSLWAEFEKEFNQRRELLVIRVGEEVVEEEMVFEPGAGAGDGTGLMLAPPPPNELRVPRRPIVSVAALRGDLLSEIRKGEFGLRKTKKKDGDE